MKGMAEKMSRIGRSFSDEMDIKADDAIEDMKDMLKNDEKVIAKIQRNQAKNQLKLINKARQEERRKTIRELKDKNFISKPKVSRKKPKVSRKPKVFKKVKKSKTKIVKPSKNVQQKMASIAQLKGPKITKQKVKPMENAKSAKQKMAALSPKKVKIVEQIPIFQIAKDVVKNATNTKTDTIPTSDKNYYKKKKKNLIKNKIVQAELAKRIKIGEFISIVSNILILVCLAIFIYYRLAEIETTDSMTYWLSSKLLVALVILIICGSFLKFNGLWYQLVDSVSKWQSTITFDFQIQFYLSLVFVGLLQIWTFIVNGEYDDLFPTKIPLYLFAGGLIFVAIINITLSIANIRSRSGSMWIDFKDRTFKSLGMDFMASNSTKLNPMDEMMSKFDDDQKFEEAYDDEDEDEDYYY